MCVNTVSALFFLCTGWAVGKRLLYSVPALCLCNISWGFFRLLHCFLSSPTYSGGGETIMLTLRRVNDIFFFYFTLEVVVNAVRVCLPCVVSCMHSVLIEHRQTESGSLMYWRPLKILYCTRLPLRNRRGPNYLQYTKVTSRLHVWLIFLNG